MAYPIHRMVLKSVRADSDRHHEPASHALQPGRRGQGAALRHGAVRLSRGRTNSDGELRPFLSGAAYLAIRGHVPLAPIALSGVYELLPIHTPHFYSGELTLRVGEPIETSGMTLRQTEELTARLRTAIEKLCEGEGAERTGAVEVGAVGTKG